MSEAPTVDLVTIKQAAALTGLTAKAIHRKREEGFWLEGREWFRGPDNRIYISIRGYEQWIRNGRR